MCFLIHRMHTSINSTEGSEANWQWVVSEMKWNFIMPVDNLRGVVISCTRSSLYRELIHLKSKRAELRLRIPYWWSHCTKHIALCLLSSFIGNQYILRIPSILMKSVWEKFLVNCAHIIKDNEKSYLSFTECRSN